MIFMETVVYGSPFFPLHKVTTSLFHWPHVSMRVCSGTPGAEVRPCRSPRGFQEGRDVGGVTHWKTPVTGT